MCVVLQDYGDFSFLFLLSLFSNISTMDICNKEEKKQ